MNQKKYNLIHIILVSVIVLTGCEKKIEKVNEPIYDNTNYLSQCWATAASHQPKEEILASTEPTLIKELLKGFVTIPTLEQLSGFSFYTSSKGDKHYTESIHTEKYSTFGKINPKFITFYSKIVEEILTNRLLIKLTSNYFDTYYKKEFLIYSNSYDFLESYSKKDALLKNYQELLSENKTYLFILPNEIITNIDIEEGIEFQQQLIVELLVKEKQ